MLLLLRRRYREEMEVTKLLLTREVEVTHVLPLSREMDILRKVPLKMEMEVAEELPLNTGMEIARELSQHGDEDHHGAQEGEREKKKIKLHYCAYYPTRGPCWPFNSSPN